MSDHGEIFPLEVIIPKEEIPKPAPQNMRCFSKKPDNPKSKIRWIEKVTQQYIDTLPLILLGLNYQNYFPKSVNVVPSDLCNENPGMAFFKSLFSKNGLDLELKK